MDASDLHHRLMKQRRLNGSSCIKSDGHSYWNRFQGRLGGRFGGRAAENFHYNARKMGRQAKAGDAVNPLNFVGPRSVVELRGVRADATKNIDSISSLEHKSKKCLKEAELPDYDVSVLFESPKTLSVLKQKRSAGPQNGAILVASNNRKEENEVKLHSRRDAHEGKHSRRDAHKGNFENYDRIGVDQPKHAIGDEKEPWYSNPTDGGCEAEAGVITRGNMTSQDAWMSTPMNMMKKVTLPKGLASFTLRIQLVLRFQKFS
ncbi:hypothetical protein HPP92_020841 [Vanilla planifolia]|uniref:Uncharacterized protein n=1 Tax=Vanilla planifolia TaxID=51239 RepID=A0A835PXT2_VANPL|nr:hypothetical protein HPP92_020841 [Vanilla planifolia]